MDVEAAAPRRVEDRLGQDQAIGDDHRQIGLEREEIGLRVEIAQARADDTPRCRASRRPAAPATCARPCRARQGAAAGCTRPRISCPASCSASSVGTANSGVPMKITRIARAPSAPSLSKGSFRFQRRARRKSGPSTSSGRRVGCRPWHRKRSRRSRSALARLPGLGPRSARRAVLWLVKRRETALVQLLQRALGGAGHAGRMPRVRQRRHARSVRHLRRPAARPAPAVRGRGRRRLVGARSGQAVQRPLSRARRAALRARRHPPRGPQHRQADRARGARRASTKSCWR